MNINALNAYSTLRTSENYPHSTNEEITPEKTRNLGKFLQTSHDPREIIPNLEIIQKITTYLFKVLLEHSLIGPPRII